MKRRARVSLKRKPAQVIVVDVTTETVRSRKRRDIISGEKNACRALCHLQPPVAVAAPWTQSLMAWLVEVASLIMTVILNGIHVD